MPVTHPSHPDHECPHPACSKRLPPHILACRDHWFQLPPLIRQRIWQTYRRGQTLLTASPAYRAALADAGRYWAEKT